VPKITFIRHAEPAKDGDLSADGLIACRNTHIPYDREPGNFPIYVSKLARSRQTASELFTNNVWILQEPIFNEWNKDYETADHFKERVRLGINFLKRINKECVVVGHARWMNWAYWLLKGEPTLGFDYLESFEHEF
jgi:broad specificity phosphatase PhoE